ncbi:hypothetical protein [Roseibium sp. SCP14]|uniref:hypothetical protein n=1 Tax=Roseibium sp. SCP14 TaxID=3141375 RepID=UPI00333A4D4E
MTGIGFLIWGAPGWGLWFDLHEDDAKQKDDPRRDTAFVKFIDAISFGSDHVAMFWRHGLFVAPYLAVVAWAYAAPVVTLFAPVFAVLGVLAYALKKLSGLGNRHSEFAIGAFWWALVLAVFLSASG